MSYSDKTHSSPFLKRYNWIISIVWTLAIVISLAMDSAIQEKETHEVARIQARIIYEKDIIYRHWNAAHGGVYVPVSEDTQPNPYLSHVPERDITTPSGEKLTIVSPVHGFERDITTPSGRRLTLVNPAFMTRQVQELAAKQYGVLGHITSLKLVRPENAPDPWETKALQSFNQGGKEFSSIEDIGGKKYMRLMRPLKTQEGCLKCHAVHGYKVGDIRGGISVSIPMDPLWVLERRHTRTFVLVHIIIWLLGLGGIVLGSRSLRRSDRERDQALDSLKESKAKVTRLYQQILQDKQAAETANQAKSIFLTSMSHELRTPLNAVIGFSQVLQKRYFGDLNDKQLEYVGDILDSAQHLLSLINDILDLSKVEAGKMDLELSTFNLKHLLENSLVMIKEKALKHQLFIALEIPPNLDTHEITGDERKIKQILFNLLSNAAKFTPDGGQIRLGAKLVTGYSLLDTGSEQPATSNEQRVTEDFIEISVTDTGLGISPEDQEIIFKEFYQVSPGSGGKTHGTGLGLPLAKHYVELQGGKIWMESEGEGKGSRFSFVIPVKPVNSK